MSHSAVGYDEIGLKYFTSAASASPRRLGAYSLTRRIGGGGCGEVYLAEAPNGALMAIKILAPELAQDERFLVRFYQEAKLAMRLESQYIMGCDEVGESGGVHYYTMQYAAGGDLARYVSSRGPLDELTALRIVRDLARGLMVAHAAGLLHRDIKPSNILIVNHRRVVLSDWGFAKELPAQLGLTQDAQGLGTPRYIAPEQFRDAKNVDVRADVYGLGATLYHLVTGQPPFSELSNVERFWAKYKNEYTPPEKINSKLHRSTARLIQKAMHGDLRKRCQSAELLLAGAESAIRAILKDRSAAQEVVETLWKVAYVSSNGSLCRLEGGTSKIKQMVLNRQLERDARVSRDGKEFVPMSSVAEFAQMFVPANGKRFEWRQFRFPMVGRFMGIFARTWLSMRSSASNSAHKP